MLGVLRSGRVVKKCISLETMVRRRVMLGRSADWRRRGRRGRASRKVETTLTVMVDSLSAMRVYWRVAIAAFSITASMRGRVWQRVAKALTEL